IRLPTGGEEGRFIARDERNDLAVVHVAAAHVEPMRFRDGKGIRPADGIVALGFPYAGLLAQRSRSLPARFRRWQGCSTTRDTCNSPLPFSRATAVGRCSTLVAMW